MKRLLIVSTYLSTIYLLLFQLQCDRFGFLRLRPKKWFKSDFYNKKVLQMYYFCKYIPLHLDEFRLPSILNLYKFL